VALSAFALSVALTACGDKKEEPAAPAAGQEEKKAEPAAAKEAGTPAPEAKAEESKKTEAGKETAEEAAAPADAAAPAELPKPEPTKVEEPAVAPFGNIQVERALQKVTAFGVTGPIGKTRERIVALLPADLQATAGMALDAALGDLSAKAGLKNMEWLDQTRGVGFAFEGKDRPLVAIPIVDEEKFKAALPEGVAPDENHGYKFEESYVLPYGKVLLVSDSFRTIDLIEGDLKLELTRVATDEVLMLTLAGASLKTLVSTLLDEMERNLGENMPMQQEQKEFLARFFNLIKELIADIDKITFTLDIEANDLVFRHELACVPGSKLATTLEALRPGSFKTASLLPAKSFMMVAQTVPQEVYGPWIPRYVDMMASAWRMNDAEREQFGKLYAELIGYFGPDSAFGIYADSAFPLSMSAVTASVDGLAARERLFAFYDLIFKRMLQELPPENRQMFANRSLKEIVNGLAPVFANVGISIKLESEDYRGAKVDYLMLEFDWAKLRLPPDAAWLKQVIQKQLGGAFGFSKNLTVFTFGPNPVVRAKEALDGTPGLTLTDTFGASFDETKYALVFAASVPKIIDSLNEIPIVATALAAQPWVEKLKASKGLQGLAGKMENGGWLEVRIDIKAVVDIVAPMIAAELKGAESEGGTEPKGL